VETAASSAPALTLAEARGLVDRALEKAAELGVRGTFVVVDAGGNVMSISRMEGAPGAGIGISRAKAAVAALTHETTNDFAARMHLFPERFSAYQQILREDVFPGPGGLPIRKNGQVVGALSTGPGTFVYAVQGVDPTKFFVDGEPGNAEDIIIAYALQIPYRNQHPLPPH